MAALQFTGFAAVVTCRRCEVVSLLSWPPENIMCVVTVVESRSRSRWFMWTEYEYMAEYKSFCWHSHQTLLHCHAAVAYTPPTRHRSNNDNHARFVPATDRKQAWWSFLLSSVTMSRQHHTSRVAEGFVSYVRCCTWPRACLRASEHPIYKFTTLVMLREKPTVMWFYTSILLFHFCFLHLLQRNVYFFLSFIIICPSL